MKSKHKIKFKIVNLFKKDPHPVSKRKIAKLLNVSPATTSKYVDILHAEGILKVKDYGNINLVSLRGGEEKEKE